MTASLLAAVRDLPRRRLDSPPSNWASGPGIYLQFLDAEHLSEFLGSTIATAAVPSYAGVAERSLRERIGRYRQSLRGVEAIGPENILIAALPCDSRASALFAEAALIDAFDPVLNGTGWGAKVPGKNRTGQRCSPIDALIPGRAWASAASQIDHARARLRVISRLARLDPNGLRWPAP
jgi:hypothetical protein